MLLLWPGASRDVIAHFMLLDAISLVPGLVDDLERTLGCGCDAQSGDTQSLALLEHPYAVLGHIVSEQGLEAVHKGIVLVLVIAYALFVEIGCDNTGPQCHHFDVGGL